jgi:type I restriction enzyme S subunit
MAVWSLTSLKDLRSTRRADSEFFRPEYLFAEQRVRVCDFVELGRLGGFVPGPFGSAFHVQNYDFKSPYRYIRGKDVKPFFLLNDDNRYLPASDFHRLSQYEVCNDDLMISVVGTLGNVAICTDEDVPAMFSCKSTLFRSKEADPYFLLAYLNSSTGLLCMLRRQRGAIQSGLNIEDLRTIPVPRFGEEIELELASDVRTAHRKLLASRDAYNAAQQLLEAELGLDKLTFQKPVGYAARFSTVNWSGTFSAGRVDAQCFAPDALFYENWLKTHTQCDRLGALLKSTAKGRQQADSIDGTTDYCSIKHITGRELDGASKCFAQADAPLAGVNDLLLAITGATIGKIGIVKRYERLAFSGDLLCLRVAESIDPHYLLLALDHKIGQVQFKRWITGSTNGHIAPRDVVRVLVPRLSSETEAQISELVRSSLAKRQESERLLGHAKTRVEQLIEAAVQS